MKNSRKNIDHENYNARFYQQKFSAYDFMKLFCAILSRQGKFSFYRDSLIDFINTCKFDGEYNNLLGGINLKSNGIFYYSKDLQEAITKLKFGGILYTISPETNSLINIYEDIPTEEFIYNQMKYEETMVEFVSNYKDFESQQHTNPIVKKFDNTPLPK